MIILVIFFENSFWHQIEKMDFIVEKYQKYRKNEMTRNEYIRCVAYKYLARTDNIF